MASKFPTSSSFSAAALPRFTQQQVAFLEDMLINKACGPAMLNSLHHSEPAACMECAARVEGLVNVIRDLKE